MLIHLQNTYVPRGKRRPGHCEAQSHRTSQQGKNTPCRNREHENTVLYWETGEISVNHTIIYEAVRELYL
jgi:predicted GNAT family acetyltransferase